MKNKLKTKNQKATTKWIQSEVEEIDKTKEIEGDVTLDISTSEVILQDSFDNFSRHQLQPEFYPQERSVGNVKKSIYKFFEKEFKKNLDDEDDFLDMLNIILSKDNEIFRPREIKSIE